MLCVLTPEWALAPLALAQCSLNNCLWKLLEISSNRNRGEAHCRFCWAVSASPPNVACHARVGDKFVFLMGLEEEEVKKNLGCEDFTMVALQKSPLDY